MSGKLLQNHITHAASCWATRKWQTYSIHFQSQRNNRPVFRCLFLDRSGRQILRSIRVHLKPGAPLVVAGNQYAYASQPLLLAAWGQRWRQHGASPEEVQVKLGKILQGADPPHSEAAVRKLLHDAGFGDATRFFSSLFWSAWLTCKTV
ncbi:hypothetical protein EMIT0196MI5_230022 [Pseudomonas sp. IT-196MI5]